MNSRASIRVGAPASIAATVTAFAVVRKSRPIVGGARSFWPTNPLKILRVVSFSPSSARRPLADDAERASEAARR